MFNCNCESSFCLNHINVACSNEATGVDFMKNVGGVCAICIHYIVMNGGGEYLTHEVWGPTPVSFEESGMMVRVGSEVLWRGFGGGDDFEFVTVTKVTPDNDGGFPWVGTVEVRSASGIKSVCSSMDLSPSETQDFDFATQATFAGFDFDLDDEELF